MRACVPAPSGHACPLPEQVPEHPRPGPGTHCTLERWIEYSRGLALSGGLARALRGVEPGVRLPVGGSVLLGPRLVDSVHLAPASLLLGGLGPHSVLYGLPGTPEARGAAAGVDYNRN